MLVCTPSVNGLAVQKIIRNLDRKIFSNEFKYLCSGKKRLSILMEDIITIEEHMWIDYSTFTIK